MMRTLCILSFSLMLSASWAADGRREISNDMMPLNLIEPGSYVLTEDVTADNNNGIIILVDNVTLDLNGFHLYGGAGVYNGIVANGNRVNLTVKNGTVRGWGNDGINLSSASNVHVQAVRVFENGNRGLAVGTGSLIVDVIATGNNDHGIEANTATVIAHCVSRNNGRDGIHGVEAVNINHAVARSNNGDGIDAGDAANVNACVVRSNDDQGIRVGKASRISDSVAFGNDHGFELAGLGSSITYSTAYGNDVGIVLGDGGTARGNTLYANSLGAIVASNHCFIAGNTFGATNDTAISVQVVGDGTRVEANHVINGLRGYSVEGVDSLVVKNSSTGIPVGTNDFVISAGNLEGDESNNPETAGAWDNFGY